MRSKMLQFALMPLFLTISGTFSHLEAQPLAFKKVGTPGDDFGWSIDQLGDVNGDGSSDIVVGARYAGFTAGAPDDHIAVFSGADGSRIWGVGIPGPAPAYTHGGLGWSVAGIGDVNGDEIPDVAAGAPSDSTVYGDGGSVKIYSGANGALICSAYGHQSRERFGHDVSGVGDINGDNVPDVVVGTEVPLSSPGNAYVISANVPNGQNCAVIRSFQDSQSPNPSSGQYGAFGMTVSGVGDINDDTVPDIVIGAWLDDRNGFDSGAITIFSGTPDKRVLRTWHGDHAIDYLGISLGRAGDVNGDGADDLVVGATGYNGSRGQGIDDDLGLARVYDPKTGAILYNFLGNERDRFLGMAVNGAGDINRDGFADIIAGSWGYFPTFGAESPDYAEVFSGIDGRSLGKIYARLLDNGSGFNQLGRAVSSAGDVNRDGFADIAIGAPEDESAGTSAGSASVFWGRSTSGLTMTGAPEVRVGDLYTLNISGGTPGERMVFYLGRSLDKTPAPSCTSKFLSINASRIGGAADVGADGTITLTRTIPEGMRGQDLILQAQSGCKISNIVRLKVVDG